MQRTWSATITNSSAEAEGDLLTGVSNGAHAGVNTVLLDPGKELSFLDGHGLFDTPLEGIENGGTQTGTGQPSEGSRAHSHQAQGNERIEWDAAHPVHVEVDQHHTGHASTHQHGDQAACQLVASSGLAQLEKGVPVEVACRSGRAGRTCSGGGRGGTASLELALYAFGSTGAGAHVSGQCGDGEVAW